VVDDTGAVADALTAARAALASTGVRLAEADRRLAETVGNAHRVAVESARRLAKVQSEIDAAVARRRTATATQGREFSRFLLEKNREISAVVADAQAEARAATVVLQNLVGQYTG
jgi:hypothetical protein